MQYFLAKTEPSVYSIDELEKLGEDYWDGVNNPQANNFIKQMRGGDIVLIYHSGTGEPAIVGTAKVIRQAEADKKNPKSFVPWFKFVRKFDTPVSLKEIKESHLFDDWYLVKQGRLSTMSVPENFINWLKTKGIKI
jgi:predicted RNA-binding protein with PUA-like domain